MERNTSISFVDLGCGRSCTNNFITRSEYFSFNAGDITQLHGDLKRLICVLSDTWKVILDGGVTDDLFIGKNILEEY